MTDSPQQSTKADMLVETGTATDKQKARLEEVRSALDTIEEKESQDRRDFIASVLEIE